MEELNAGKTHRVAQKDVTMTKNQCGALIVSYAPWLPNGATRGFVFDPYPQVPVIPNGKGLNSYLTEEQERHIAEAITRELQWEVRRKALMVSSPVGRPPS
jgi:hypothetical protein